MRHLSLLGAIAIASMFTLPTHASWQHWSLDEHSTDNSLTWKNSEGHSLDLDSAAGKGVTIVKIEGNGMHGLQPGDVILAVNGHAVKRVADLISQANANEHGTTTVALRRGHENKRITIAGSDLYALIHPHP
ncbi:MULTISPECIES: PDZ domain-containing protein [Rhodanobacter]|uniref:PDZ domain-containing protein n=1 Tax=Rhodanobacter TaxID=75309 RepID=UPI0003FA31BD|nr:MULTISPECIES: PDZ domain-containing protein [Rhodanobacter]UJJ53194.1 PDZ domain-containing protein [Rhodanobacter thiooxydans]